MVQHPGSPTGLRLSFFQLTDHRYSLSQKFLLASGNYCAQVYGSPWSPIVFTDWSMQDLKAWALSSIWEIFKGSFQCQCSLWEHFEAVTATTVQFSFFSCPILLPFLSHRCCSREGASINLLHSSLQISGMFPRILNCDGQHRSPMGHILQWDFHFWIHPESH